MDRLRLRKDYSTTPARLPHSYVQRLKNLTVSAHKHRIGLAHVGRMGQCAPAGGAVIAQCAPTDSLVVMPSRVAYRAVTSSLVVLHFAQLCLSAPAVLLVPCQRCF